MLLTTHVFWFGALKECYGVLGGARWVAGSGLVEKSCGVLGFRVQGFSVWSEVNVSCSGPKLRTLSPNPKGPVKQKLTRKKTNNKPQKRLKPKP